MYQGILHHLIQFRLTNTYCVTLAKPLNVLDYSTYLLKKKNNNDGCGRDNLVSILSNYSPNTTGRLMIPNWRCGIDWCKSSSASCAFDSCRNLGPLRKRRLHPGTCVGSEMSENTFLFLGLEVNFARCLREIIFFLNSYSLDTCNGYNVFFLYLSPDTISHSFL